METPYVCSALMWYGVVCDIIWDHMISYGMGSISYFLFQGKDLVLCNHWNFLCTLADLLPNRTMWSRRPKSYFLCWSCQKRKEQARAFPFSEFLEYVKNFSASIQDHWPCFVVCYWVSLAVICCSLTRDQTAKLPNCHCHPDWAPRESFNPTPWIAFYPIERTHTHLRCECAR